MGDALVSLHISDSFQGARVPEGEEQEAPSQAVIFVFDMIDTEKCALQFLKVCDSQVFIIIKNLLIFEAKFLLSGQTLKAINNHHFSLRFSLLIWSVDILSQKKLLSVIVGAVKNEMTITTDNVIKNVREGLESFSQKNSHF